VSGQSRHFIFQLLDQPLLVRRDNVHTAALANIG
jgi:hypothetical protein